MRKKKHLALAVALLFAISAFARAEDSEKEHHGQGYLFYAPGGVFEGGRHAGTTHLGGGGEGLIYKGVGIGAEIGYLSQSRAFLEGVGVFSVNGSYHFRRNRSVSPFITGGYTAFFRNGHVNLVNFGGGVNWWFKERVGLRLEFRDHLYSQSRSSQTDRSHYVSGRIALAFR